MADIKTRDAVKGNLLKKSSVVCGIIAPLK